MTDAMETTRCTNCGAVILTTTVECGRCRTPQRRTAEKLLESYGWTAESTVYVLAAQDPDERVMGDPAWAPDTQRLIHDCKAWVQAEEDY